MIPFSISPNHIGAATWAGWVQERGLYFLGEKDPKYIDLVSMVDSFKDNPGEKLGSFVEGKTGKGRWIYLGLGLWRQLPAGTDGAYRTPGANPDSAFPKRPLPHRRKRLLAPRLAERRVMPYTDDAPYQGRLIGQYRLCDRIGEGGMGEVYLAERENEFRQRVAIKLIRPGMANLEVVRRFVIERQTLAALNHPQIVRLVDGGTTDDHLPYLVVDYVSNWHSYRIAMRMSKSSASPRG